MSEIPQGRQSPEVGTLSADGSRRWDGRFWTATGTARAPADLPAFVARPVAEDLVPDRRGFGLGGVVLAAAVALVLTVIPIPMPPATSLEMALSEANSVLSFHFWAPIIAAVLILSVRRQGIDVLLLRAVVVEFIYGATFLSLIVGALVSIHIPITPRVPWPVVVVAGALIWAVAIGLFVGVVAALANVLWFRTFNTLRPQLRLRRRG